jgi:RIO-like serine/threonine protein kinase
MEEIPGKNVEGMERERKLPGTFFDDLRILLEKIHARGLAHCDLKRAPNIMLGEDGKPYIVDWSAAITRSEFRPFPLNHIYQRFLKDDRNAVIKLMLRHCPEWVTPEEKQQYGHRSRPERMIRHIRDRARELLQKIA